MDYPPDAFNTITFVKTTGKKGGVAQVKRIPNSIIKVDIYTDKEDWTNIKENETTGFDFSNVDFGDFSFGAGVRGYITF